MAAIETHELAREYDEGAIKAVDGVDLEVSDGEIYGFLGPNGAGKTTTVRMLTTLLEPTGGWAAVAGFNVLEDPGSVRRKIGVALQEAALDPLMTGRELIHLQATLHGLPRKRGDELGDSLLHRVGLSQAADRRVGTYSGGMRRRLDLAAALVHEPEVLFLDEPTTGLDPVSRQAIWEEVAKLNDEGTTVFLTTQYLEEADKLADRVGIIARGQAGGRGHARGRSRPRSASPTWSSRSRTRAASTRRARRSWRASASHCRRRDGLLLVELEHGASEVGPIVSALDDAGLLVESPRPGASRRWTTSSSPRPASTWRARTRAGAGLAGRRRTPEVARLTREPGDQRAGGRRPRGPLCPPDDPPAPACGAAADLPHPAAGDPDRRRRGSGEPAAASPTSTASSTSCWPGR